MLDVRELQHAPGSLWTARPLSSRRQALLALAPVDGASAPSEFRVRASGIVPDIPASRFALVQAALRSGTGVDPYATSSALTDREVALSWSSSKSRRAGARLCFHIRSQHPSQNQPTSNPRRGGLANIQKSTPSTSDTLLKHLERGARRNQGQPGQQAQKVSGWHIVSWYLPLLTLATFSAGTQLGWSSVVAQEWC